MASDLTKIVSVAKNVGFRFYVEDLAQQPR